MPYPYSSSSWRNLPRDGDCQLADLLGGECRGRLSLHHITPLSEGGAFDGDLLLACASHHRRLEAARKRGEPRPRTCSHRHLYPGAREACERRLQLADGLSV